MTSTDQDNAPSLGGRNSRTGREPRLGGDNALHHLALSLQSDDWQVRRQAAEKLQSLGTGATTLLIEALRSENMHTRRVAVQTLGLIGGAEAIEALIGALGDIHHAVRKDAASALVRIVVRSRAPGRSLIVLALLYYNAVHGGLNNNLHAIRDEIVPELADALLDEDVRVTSAGWQLLLNSSTLIRRTRHRPYQLRINLILDLIGCLANTRIAPEADPQAALLQIRAELVSRLQHLIAAAPDTQMTMLVELSVYPASRILEAFRILARAESARTRRVAMENLGIWGDRDSIPLITDALLNDLSPEVRAALPDVLRRLDDPGLVTTLKASLKQEQNLDVIKALLNILNLFDPLTTFRVRLGMLLSPEEEWREYATISLGLDI